MWSGIRTNRLDQSILDELRHGPIGHKRIGPSHQGDSPALEFLIRTTYVGLLNRGEQASLRCSKGLGHTLLHSNLPEDKGAGSLIGTAAPQSITRNDTTYLTPLSSGFQKKNVSTAAITKAITNPAMTIAQL